MLTGSRLFALALCCFAAVPTDSAAGAAAETWVSRFDGGLNDEPSAMVIGPTGGIYVTGISAGPGQYDVLTVKYDNRGEEIWSARFNGPANAYDESSALGLNRYSELFVAVSTQVKPNDLDFTVLKYSGTTGELAWARHLDGQRAGSSSTANCEATKTANCRSGPLHASNDRASDLAVMPDGGVVVTGSVSGANGYDYLTARFDRAGNLLWSARYDGPAGSSDLGVAVTVDTHANTIVSGRSRGDKHFDIVTLKYGPAGQLLWSQRYDGPAGWFDEAADLAVTDDGNIVVAGSSFGPNGATAGVILLYSSDGKLGWAARPFDDQGASTFDRVAIDAANNIVVAGSIASAGNWNYLTAKADSAGQMLWSAEYDGQGRTTDRVSALALDTRGNAFVSGVTNMTDDSQCEACPTVTTLKYAAASGQIVWEANYKGPRPGANRAAALTVHHADVVVAAMSAGLGTARGKIGESPRDFAVLFYQGAAD
jgi:hypothetical protein